MEEPSEKGAWYTGDTSVVDTALQWFRILGSDGTERALFGDVAAAQARAEALASFQDGVSFQIIDESGAEV